MVYNGIHSKGKFSVVVENKQALQEHFISSYPNKEDVYKGNMQNEKTGPKGHT